MANTRRLFSDRPLIAVGESPSNETAITVTGLKPSHFYNLRVVAVGPGNFRAGSPLLRLKTFGKDGRPQLGNSRLPTSFVDPDHPRAESGDEGENPDRPRCSFPSVEAAAVLDTNANLGRDLGPAAASQRRNTVNRRHSPSVASTDQPQIRPPVSSELGMSLAELNERFEGIRREIDDTLALFAKDEAESQQQEEELKRERDRKRHILKEREEQTTQLKVMMRSTMEQMRAAEKERAKKEQQLKDKETKKTKIRDNINKYETEIERMKMEREGFEAQKKELALHRDRDVDKLNQDIAELQDNCATLEAELKDKGKQLQDLKATREQLPGADDELWRDEDVRIKREWEFKRRDIHNRLVAETKAGHILNQQIRALSDQLSMQQQAGLPYFGQPSSASLDFAAPSPTVQPKRLSLNSGTLPATTLPSPDRIPPAEPGYPSSAGFINQSFVPNLYMDMIADGAGELHTETELKAAGGPLSPSAKTLLPSNIFEESEDTDAMAHGMSILPEPTRPGEDGPQSPASSIMSFPVFSSPHGSSNNLAFPPYSNDIGDRGSLRLSSSPPPASATGTRIASFLSSFQRSRGPKTSDDGGPVIGSLKPGQSQSFPTAADEGEALAGRRRLNLPSWMNRNSVGPDGTPQGSSIAASKPFSALRLGPLRGSATSMLSDRDRELSRPASIASTDLPRPSTDSGSIWGVPADSLGAGKNRLWSPSDGRWPSRSGSRRPSLQGCNVLTTTLASADDEILDEDDLLNPESMPSQVGVIGSRPPASSKSMVNQQLNPAAPTFMGHIFRKDRDRDREGSSRGKSQDRGKDGSREENGKGVHSTPSSIELALGLDASPSGSRMSRDAYSVHTQTSVSESHESLQLDLAVSSTASDVNSASHSKDAENVVRKLFRKGSSSKFSLSSRLGKDSGLFKKGPGSTANSDKNMSAEHRSSIGDLDDLGEDVAVLGRSYDSITSSPSLGPSKSKDGREGGRMSSWRFSMSSIKKKGKDAPARERESSELEAGGDED